MDTRPVGHKQTYQRILAQRVILEQASKVSRENAANQLAPFMLALNAAPRCTCEKCTDELNKLEKNFNHARPDSE